MRIISTQISQPSPDKTDRCLVTLLLADSEEPEIKDETISINVRVETENDTPYLKEVQRAALEKARRELDLQILATKTVPRPSA